MAEEEVWQNYNQLEGCPGVFLHFLFPSQPNGPSDDTADNQQDCIAIKPDLDDGMEDKPCDALYYTSCEMTIRTWQIRK